MQKRPDLLFSMFNYNTEVVNIKFDEYDVLIQRGTIWGNPYRIGVDGTRNEVLKKYEMLLLNKIRSGIITLDELRSLSGKRLGCSCKINGKNIKCHGDIIAKYVNLLCSEYYTSEEKEKIFNGEYINNEY